MRHNIYGQRRLYMAEIKQFWIDRAATPIGELIVVADHAGALRAVDWTEHETRMQRLLRLHYGPSVELEAKRDPHGFTTALRSYFTGKLTAIETLPVATGGTPFQRSVWTALREI